MTSHGILQTKRLGAHIAGRIDDIGPVKSVFTSNLQRAYQTAAAIIDAQPARNHSPNVQAQAPLDAVQLAELREKDFGSSEGKKFGNKTAGLDGDAQSDSETRDAMKARIDRFIDVHLSPVLDRHASEKVCVVVVAHGIILGMLLRTLLSRYSTRQPGALDHHGEAMATWSNTGILQMKVEPLVDSPPSPTTRQQGFRAIVQFTNNVDHLQGLKKTRGGIGSAKFDAKQRTMDSFFGPSKKRKLSEPED